jgi:hypothetical protein
MKIPPALPRYAVFARFARLFLLSLPPLWHLLACTNQQALTPDGQPNPAQIIEDRFDNDRRLVKELAKLQDCAGKDQPLESACRPMQELAKFLRSRSDTVEDRQNIVKTLVNLLQSKRAITRTAVAELLLPYRREPSVKGALREALAHETVPQTQVTLLRQLCWQPSLIEEDQLLIWLAVKKPEAVRLEAVACLGRLSHLSAPAALVLRQILQQDKSLPVRGAACSVLGTHHHAAALADLVAALADPVLRGRCSAAIAALGGQEAYESLWGVLSTRAPAGGVSAQEVLALTHFAKQPYFKLPAVVEFLQKIALQPRADWVARVSAIQEIHQLGDRVTLRRLQSVLKGELLLDPGVTRVAATVEQLLKVGH